MMRGIEHGRLRSLKLASLVAFACAIAFFFGACSSYSICAAARAGDDRSRHERTVGHGRARATGRYHKRRISSILTILKLPYWKSPFYKEFALPQGPVFHVAGITFDMSITKHVVFMLFSALVVMLLLVFAGQASKAHHQMIGRPRGVAAAVEAMALYLRNDVVLPNVGPHGEKFVPFALTLFYFILLCNLFGLLPYGSTATGNISVTATLAIVTFFVVEIAGVLSLGMGYLGTIFYWNKDLPMFMRVVMFFVMTPVEIVGKFAKPFALTIRLFANMTAGHIILLALIGLIFTFKSWAVAGVPVAMATALSALEIFVSFLQAFIFTLLACVFIGQMRESHH